VTHIPNWNGLRKLLGKKEHRIEAMLFLYFIALMIVSLIERKIRMNMAAEEIDKLPILPQGMNTKKPTWNNIRYFYRNVHFSQIIRDGACIQSMVQGIGAMHEQINHRSTGYWKYPRRCTNAFRMAGGNLKQLDRFENKAPCKSKNYSPGMRNVRSNLALGSFSLIFLCSQIVTPSPAAAPAKACVLKLAIHLSIKFP
jgi:hypothetical protein